jgi:hypothetical protein
MRFLSYLNDSFTNIQILGVCHPLLSGKFPRDVIPALVVAATQVTMGMGRDWKAMGKVQQGAFICSFINTGISD